MPRHVTKAAQVEDGVPASQVEHLLLVEEISLLAELVAQMRQDGHRLVADLAGGKRRLHLGQLLQLGADTEPVSGRGHRHVASPSDPGSRGDVAADQMSAGILGIAALGAKVTLERVDNPSIRRQIQAAALSASKD